MRLYLLPLAVALLAPKIHAQPSFESGYATEKEAQQRDMDALQEYIKTKRVISVKEKGGNMMISGDIRGEWYCMHAKTDHKYQRGWASRNLFPNSAYNKAEPTISHKEYKALSFNGRLKYRKGRDEILPPRHD